MSRVEEFVYSNEVASPVLADNQKSRNYSGFDFVGTFIGKLSQNCHFIRPLSLIQALQPFAFRWFLVWLRKIRINC